VRDGQVLLATLRALTKSHSASTSRLALGKFERVLDRRHRELRAKVLKKSGPLKRARKTLRAVRTRSEHWHVGRRGWSVLGAGLRRTYAQGRRAFAQARSRHSDECLHEWRKQIQYFSHQLQIFELESSPLAGLVEETREIAAFLGDDHDLAILRARAAEAREVFPSAAAQRTVMAAIERFRAGLQEKALQLGQHLYEETPAVFTARFGRYWREWRHAS
jgi:hypothetical protein